MARLARRARVTEWEQSGGSQDGGLWRWSRLLWPAALCAFMILRDQTKLIGLIVSSHLSIESADEASFFPASFMAGSGSGRDSTLATTAGSEASTMMMLQEPLETIQARASQWRNNLPDHVARATYVENMYQHTHDRFFSFEPLATCKSTTEIGRSNHTKRGKFDDDSKTVCGLEDIGDGAQLSVFQQPGCIIYSIGSNNEFGFEEDLLHRTQCEIHTFDCTGPASRFTNKPNHHRSHFHHICLSHEYVAAPPRCHGRQVCGEMMTLAQLQVKLNHTAAPALLKIDVEGFEIPLFRSWWAGTERARMPTQMLVEIHYFTFEHFATNIQNKYMKQHNPDTSSNPKKLIQNAAELVLLNLMLMEMGYIVAVKENNPLCAHCMEVVLVRVPPQDLWEKKNSHSQLE